MHKKLAVFQNDKNILNGFYFIFHIPPTSHSSILSAFHRPSTTLCEYISNMSQAHWYLHSHQSTTKSDVNYSANFINSSGPHVLKPWATNCDTSHIIWTITPLPLMVVPMTAAPCPNKDLHINGYKKETWIEFHDCSIPIPVYQSMLKSCNFD